MRFSQRLNKKSIININNGIPEQSSAVIEIVRRYLEPYHSFLFHHCWFYSSTMDNQEALRNFHSLTVMSLTPHFNVSIYTFHSAERDITFSFRSLMRYITFNDNCIR